MTTDDSTSHSRLAQCGAILRCGFRSIILFPLPLSIFVPVQQNEDRNEGCAHGDLDNIYAAARNGVTHWVENRFVDCRDMRNSSAVVSHCVSLERYAE